MTESRSSPIFVSFPQSFCYFRDTQYLPLGHGLRQKLLSEPKQSFERVFIYFLLYLTRVASNRGDYR